MLTLHQLEMSALETLHEDQIVSSTQLIKPNYPILKQPIYVALDIQLYHSVVKS